MKAISKFIGKIKLPIPKFHDAQFIEVEKLLQIGDVILSRRSWALSNLWIDGHYKHAAIYIGDGRVVEAIFKGVVDTSLRDFCFKKDSICVVRPRIKILPAVRMEVVAKAISLIGSKYDFSYIRGGDEYYCSELIEECWGNITNIPTRKVLGRTILIPEDLKTAINWKTVVEFQNECG